MKNKLDYINKQVCQREELSKKEDRVSKKGCINEHKYFSESVTVYRKRKSFEKEGLYDSLKRTGCIERTGSFEKGQTLYGKLRLIRKSPIKQGSRGKGKLRTFLKRMDFVRRVWSQGIAAR